MVKTNKYLLIGIGNSGRADDGLGWAFLDKIAQNPAFNFDLEYRYQLQIEDAELISNYENVYFIDAHYKAFDKGFDIYPCEAKSMDSFSSHELSPQSILALAKTIYNKEPTAYILGISGQDFRLHSGISNIAQHNLDKALQYFTHSILPILITDKSHQLL